MVPAEVRASMHRLDHGRALSAGVAAMLGLTSDQAAGYVVEAGEEATGSLARRQPGCLVEPRGTASWRRTPVR